MFPVFLTAGLDFCSVDRALIVKIGGMVMIPFVHKAIQSLYIAWYSCKFPLRRETIHVYF